MRPPLAVILLILAVPLMGSDCYVAGRVGGSPSTPPDDVVDPPPATGGGGGVIIVTSNAPGATSAVTGNAARIERSHVDAALAVSVWTPPALEVAAAIPEILDPTFVASEAWEIGSVPSGDTAQPSSPAAVPEPTGLVLFGSGLWLASKLGRRAQR